MLKIEIPWLDEWPTCYEGRYDDKGKPVEDPPLCGEQHKKSLEPGWTNLCRCPSCPLKVAISAEVYARRQREKAGAE